MGGVSELDRNPDLREQIAEALHRGGTSAEVAEAVGFSERAIRRYKKDPLIQGLLSAKREERINSVTRTIDSSLEAKINDPEERKKLSIKELLEIRRELLGPAAQRLTVSKGADEGEAGAELYRKLLENPELAEALGIAPPSPEPEQPVIDIPPEDVEEVEPDDEAA